MAIGAESVIAEAWIEDQLDASVALQTLIDGRVYCDVAPPNATYPFVVYQQQDGTDENAVGAIRIMSSFLYVVKACSQTSYASLRTTVEAIDAALTDVVGGAATGGGNAWGCYREAPFRLLDQEDGSKLFWLGGQYRIYAQG